MPSRSACGSHPCTRSVRVTHARSGSPAAPTAVIEGVFGHAAVGRPLAAGDRDQPRGFDARSCGPAKARRCCACRGARPAGGCRRRRSARRPARAAPRNTARPSRARTQSPARAAAARAATSVIGVSVVPTSVWPCHGTANITRPSGVFGTMRPLPPGRNDRSNTRWMPWLGAMSAGALGHRQATHAVDERSGGVDDHAGRQPHLAPGLDVDRDDAVDDSSCALRHARDLGVVQHDRTVLGGRLHQVDHQPGVVELPVEVGDPAAEAARAQRGDLARVPPARERIEERPNPCRPASRL